MEYYSAIKNEITAFAATEKQPEIIISEVSQKEKDKHHMISLICGIEKEVTQMNLLTKQKQTHRLRD